MWSEIINTVSVVIAVGSAITAWVYHRRAGRAAADAVAAQQRAADAHATLARHADVEALRPPWHLRHAGGGMYELVNSGPTPRFDVRVDGESLVLVSGGTPTCTDQLAAGSTLPFMAASTTDTNSTITVEWCDSPSAEQRSWSRQLPAPPARSGE